MNASTRAAPRTSILIRTFAAIAGLATSASAQVPTAATPVCPARYEPMNGLCYNRMSGDVVMAEIAAAAPVLTDANCRAGYAILFETMCYSRTTGDIEFASSLAPQRAAELPIVVQNTQR